MRRSIAISLSPNAEKDDVILSFKNVINPLGYNNDKKIDELEKSLTTLFGKGYRSFTVKSGREAFFLLLKALNIRKNDEILVQAFTCSAAVNPIIWAGAKPVYVDIDETYNMNPEDIHGKINKKTKAIILQHTFGVPADIKNIKLIAEKHNLLLIEDCAVSLGAKVDNKIVGTFGDATFLSFGRDKVISSVWGGAVLTKDKRLAKKVDRLHKDLKLPSHFWTFKQLLHPIVFSVVLPLYNLGYRKLTVGKIILFILQKSKIVRPPVDIEKNSNDNINKMPGSLAELAVNQLKKIERFNEKRIELAKIYHQMLKNLEIQHPVWKDGAIWLRYPIQVDDSRSLLNYAKKRGVILGDWYKQPIYPVKDLRSVYYNGLCDNVEKLENRVVNLPTYPTMTLNQIEKVIQIIRSWLASNQ